MADSPGKRRSLTSPGMENVSGVELASIAAFRGQAVKGRGRLEARQVNSLHVSSPLLSESLSLPLEELSEDSDSPRPLTGGGGAV